MSIDVMNCCPILAKPEHMSPSTYNAIKHQINTINTAVFFLIVSTVALGILTAFAHTGMIHLPPPSLWSLSGSACVAFAITTLMAFLSIRHVNKVNDTIKKNP